MSLTKKDLEVLANKKIALLKELFAAEPPKSQGEDILRIWAELYDDEVKNTVFETSSGPSTDETQTFPYEKLHAIVDDGGSWKWPRIWRRLMELERRGPAYREGDPLNFGCPNPNPHTVAQNVLVVGGGPVGLRLAIELKLGGHKVTLFEKRREKRSDAGDLQTLGFTNRINRPHVPVFLRNDLDRLNGREFMSSKMCYPVFTQADTTSIGIDELQVLLMKTALLVGVDIRLGVSFDDASMVPDNSTQKPRWAVQCTYDELAATQFKVSPGKHTETYDVLMGCDGARSRVRESQPDIFGEVDKRNFKKMVGIVANVQKVSRKRLMELGFDGREPTDMKRAHQGSGLNYYKASYHNYCIFTPTTEDLQKAGLSGDGVFSFYEGRDSAASKAKNEEKDKLKAWVLARCKEVGIPVDTELSNGGFTEAPNDCMAFDFSEIWKCKKSFDFNLPPADYDAKSQGEWTGKSLVAPIGLVGDSVCEPFWIAGVGLMRGWNGVMDACYVIDNLYNMTFSGEPEPTKAPTTWDSHMERLHSLLPSLYDYGHDGRMTKELSDGSFSDQGVVMKQLHQRGPDMEKPQMQLEVDPFERYEPLNKLAKYKYIGAKSEENPHPVVTRALAMNGVSDELFGAKKLISVNGKSVPGDAGPPPPTLSRRNTNTAALAAVPTKVAVSASEVEKSATSKVESLQGMLAKQLDKHMAEEREKATSSPTRRKTAFDDELFKQLPQHVAESGFAERAEAEWDHMTEQHLSPAQKAELVHVRNMMSSLTQQMATLGNSLEAFKRAERELLHSNGA